MILKRVEQLRDRYRRMYGDELTIDEVARYVNSLIIDRQLGELAVFDQLSTDDLIATQKVLDTMQSGHDESPIIPPSQISPSEVLESPPAPPAPPKRRGRPVGWRKDKQ